jgi:hypothetical protein
MLSASGGWRRVDGSADDQVLVGYKSNLLPVAVRYQMINRSDPLAEVGEISRSTRQIGSRIMLFNVLALLVFAVLIGRLWYLQIVNNEVYIEQAEQNRTRILMIPARRGTIFDRNGEILVTSQPSLQYRHQPKRRPRY